MGLEKIIKKAVTAISSLILAGSVGCSNKYETLTANKTILDNNPIQTIPKEKPTIKKLQYPLNIIGGILANRFVHESGHAIGYGLMGVGIDEFEVFSTKKESFGRGHVRPSTKYWDLSDTQKGFANFAGPIANIISIELISNNLKKGKISKKHQPFFATYNLINRLENLKYPIQCDNEENYGDYNNIEKHWGLKTEDSVKIMSLYALLNYKNIAKEIKVALGKEYYDTKEQKSNISVIPSPKGITLKYQRSF